MSFSKFTFLMTFVASATHAATTQSDWRHEQLWVKGISIRIDYQVSHETYGGYRPGYFDRLSPVIINVDGKKLRGGQHTVQVTLPNQMINIGQCENRRYDWQEDTRV